MGSTFSQLSILFQTLKSIVKAYRIVLDRISQSPGIPQLNESKPYWTVPPSPIAEHGKEAELPEHADVVVIGSGITGASVVRCLLENDESLTIVMLEARDACSGATAKCVLTTDLDKVEVLILNIMIGMADTYHPTYTMNSQNLRALTARPLHLKYFDSA